MSHTEPVRRFAIPGIPLAGIARDLDTRPSPPNDMIALRHSFKGLATVSVLALTLVFAACDSTTPNLDLDDAPTLIPPDAFSIDGDSLPDSTTANFQGSNHNQAAARIFIVNLAVGIHLVVPAVATGAATQVTPTVENGRWIWENTVPINSQPVTFRLEGTPDGSEIDWQMILSNSMISGQLHDDFVLYTATTSLDGTEGVWSLYYNIQGQRTRVLDADYLRTGAQRELTFTIPETNPNEEARGDFVYYMSEGNARVFDYEEAPSQNHLIEWNAATAAGSITAWNWNDGNKACWDSNLDNVPCVPTL